MSVLNLYQQKVEKEGSSWNRIFPARPENIDALARRKFCDLLVIGGGLHGLILARLAALQGLRTVLLEKADYGGGASGRGVALLHNGSDLFGNQFSFGQFERAKQLNALKRICPHLLAPIEIESSEESMVQRGIRALLRSATASHAAYVIDQSLLLNESLIAARQEGALCLNHVGLESFQVLADGTLEVGWHDYRGRHNGDLRAGAVVNCAGAAVGRVGRLFKSQLESELSYARVLTLLFDLKWSGPAQARRFFSGTRPYYVFPSGAYTAVSLLSAECDEYQPSAHPREEELERALLAIERDFARVGLIREKLFHADLCVKPLAAIDRGSDHPRYSAKARWRRQDNMLVLLAGDLPYSIETAYQGFCELARLTNFKNTLNLLRDRKLPGAASSDNAPERLNSDLARGGIASSVGERLLRRYAGCLRFVYSADGQPPDLIGSEIIRGEVDFAMSILQIESFRDLMRRGLGLEYQPGHGLEAAAEIFKYFNEKKAESRADFELMEYRGYIEKLKNLIAATV